MSSWIRHDVGSFHDPSILEIRAEHGMEGYGLFWAVVEMMAKSKTRHLHLDKIKAYALALAMPEETVRTFVDTCVRVGLFVLDEDRVKSPRLMRELEYADFRVNRSKKAAEARWAQPSSGPEPTLFDNAYSNAKSNAHCNGSYKPTNQPTIDSMGISAAHDPPTSEHGPPVREDQVVLHFERKGAPIHEAKAFYAYWDDRDWLYEDRRGELRAITANTWRRRAGYWISKWRRDTERDRNQRTGKNAPLLTHAEMLADWEKRGKPKMDEAYTAVPHGDTVRYRRR